MSEELEILVKKAKEKALNDAPKTIESKVVELEDENQKFESSLTFEKLGVCPEICEAVAKMGFKHPSKI